VITSPGAPRSASSAKRWARALELTAGIAARPHRTLPRVLEEIAAVGGDSPALLSDDQSLTFHGLMERANRYARWAIRQELSGQVVGLLMPNAPEYMAAWLGVTMIGGVVALLNTHLTGAALRHCVETAAPRALIVSPGMRNVWTDAAGDTSRGPAVWSAPEIDALSGDPLSEIERPSVSIRDRALLIYTSGTTGLPKAAVVSHARVMQWSHWFCGLMEIRSDDRMYNCLPMYHSVGGVLATGAVLAGGGSVVLRPGFSATAFWPDIARWDCTLFQYIGELCRYLLIANPQPVNIRHRIRLACGNGLAADVWEPFRDRFGIPHILEFYASTEGNVSLFNVDEKPGAVGRVPPFLRHRHPPVCVRFDSLTEQPLRDERDRCVPCAPNEPGEVIGAIRPDQADNIGSRFEGYTIDDATEAKILRDVFVDGDAWFRTGDLMRVDEQGYFYFVDRIGDTFRWKGENVSTMEVVAAISSFPGVLEAIVYGVQVPLAEGRAGMAAVVAPEGIDLAAFRRHLAERLPMYARPLFVRFRTAMTVTATFKYSKGELMRDGFDPRRTSDPIYFFDPIDTSAVVRVDAGFIERVRTGAVRL